MASIHRDFSVDAAAESVWAAVRDFGAVERLAPGFVVACQRDGEARMVTFGNGMVERELLIDCDDARRRLVYAVVSERVSHYNAVVEIVAEGQRRCRMRWTIDLLPHAIAPTIAVQMDLGVAAIKAGFARAAE